MADQLFLSYWLRNYNESTMLRNYEKLLRLFPYSRLAQQASTGPAPGGPGPQISAPSPQAGSVYVPESSKPQPGSSAHTNYLLRRADGKKPVGVQTPSEGAFGGSLPR